MFDLLLIPYLMLGKNKTFLSFPDKNL